MRKLILTFELDLVQRWLVRAKEHLRTYLQEQQGRGAGRKRSQVNSFRKMMSSSDVSRLFNTSIFDFIVIILLVLLLQLWIHICFASYQIDFSFF